MNFCAKIILNCYASFARTVFCRLASVSVVLPPGVAPKGVSTRYRHSRMPRVTDTHPSSPTLARYRRTNMLDVRPEFELREED